MSKRREIIDCFNCSAFGRPCDRSRHRCDTCTQTPEICRGYPRDLQWLNGVKSRGKDKGKVVSVETLKGGWHSTTPINHAFVFKQGKPRKKRQQGRQKVPQPPPDSSQPQPYDRVFVEAEGVIGSAARYSPSPADLSASPRDTFEDLGAFFESTETTTGPSTSTTDVWRSDGQELFGVLSETKGTCWLPSFSFPSLESSQLLTLYDQELCTLPLTYDFPENPFRCSKGLLQRPKHLLHAMLAISIQHVCRMHDGVQEELVAQQLEAYKHSATQLSTAALLTAPERPNSSLIDTMLILFALDTLFSAAGPWKERLSDAYYKIEAVKRVSRIPASSRFHAQLAMFIWWDCSVALVSRSEPVFPQSYYESILSCGDDVTWSIFTMSGVPRELFWYCRELAQLANEKEQISGLRYARFDIKRVSEIESCIRAYTEGEFDCQGIADSGDLVQYWHDYCCAGNAWKYALLLYISRVFKWDRTSDSRLPEITSLSRLVLDNVRCCRSDSPLQKQLLFPVFLAGAEYVDPYGREFVRIYCEEWYRKCRYSMFREALELMQQIWARRDHEVNHHGVWWGGLVGNRQTNGPEFLFG